MHQAMRLRHVIITASFFLTHHLPLHNPIFSYFFLSLTGDLDMIGIYTCL